MTDYACEPGVLHAARAFARLLPKGRSVLVRRVAHWTGHNRSFLAVVGNRQYLIDLNERVSRTLYLYGRFEPVIAALLKRLCLPGSTFIDAGANFGYFSLLASEALGPTGRVLAFEPDPRNVERLLTVVRVNHAHNVEHVGVGLFDREGTVTFNLSAEDEDNLGSSSIHIESSGRRQIEIPVTTLDAFAQSRGLSYIHLIKMDIEGAEVQALAGARGLLAARRIGQLLVEIHVQIIGADGAASLVRELIAGHYHAYYVCEHRAAISGNIAGFLRPLERIPWQTQPNPHCLFTAEPIPGVH